MPKNLFEIIRESQNSYQNISDVFGVVKVLKYYEGDKNKGIPEDSIEGTSFIDSDKIKHGKLFLPLMTHIKQGCSINDLVLVIYQNLEHFDGYWVRPLQELESKSVQSDAKVEEEPAKKPKEVGNPDWLVSRWGLVGSGAWRGIVNTGFKSKHKAPTTIENLNKDLLDYGWKHIKTEAYYNKRDPVEILNKIYAPHSRTHLVKGEMITYSISPADISPELIIKVTGNSGLIDIDIIDKYLLDISALQSYSFYIDNNLFFPYSLPLNGKIVLEFGIKTNIGDFHTGIDIEPYSNQKNIFAPISGKIIETNYFKETTTEEKSLQKNDYGNYIILESEKMKFKFGHLAKIFVNKNDKVYMGQVLAYVGKTGKATKPHLHLECYYKDKLINPRPLFRYKPKIENQHLYSRA